MTPANESDIGQAEALLADHQPEVVIADKGYDKKALVEEIESRGAEAAIPTQCNRKEQRTVDPHVLSGTESVRAVLVEGETVPARGDAVREEGDQLPRLRQSGRDDGDVEITRTLQVAYLVSLRPSRVCPVWCTETQANRGASNDKSVMSGAKRVKTGHEPVALGTTFERGQAASFRV